MTAARVTRSAVLVGMMIVGLVDAAGLIPLPGVSCVMLAVLMLWEV